MIINESYESKYTCGCSQTPHPTVKSKKIHNQFEIEMWLRRRTSAVSAKHALPPN